MLRILLNIMNLLVSFGLYQAYANLAELGDPLAEVASQLDWEGFGSIEDGLYDNKTEKGGHPNIDCILMIKILVLQHWYGLSDQRMELVRATDIAFMHFVDFDNTIPDCTTIWLFRERLKEKNKYEAIWQELQRQLDSKGLIVKEGSIQDATFITIGSRKIRQQASWRGNQDSTEQGWNLGKER